MDWLEGKYIALLQALCIIFLSFKNALVYPNLFYVFVIYSRE